MGASSARSELTAASLAEESADWAIAAYDRLYRRVHGLDRAASQVGPILRVEVRRSRRRLELGDGTVVRPGDRIGILHLNNERVAQLHCTGRRPMGVGLEFRRQFFVSLRALAALAVPGGRFGDVRAFGATTIFHRKLRRFGFDGGATVTWPALVAAFQRALLASLHPAGWRRLRASTYPRAGQAWISRPRLLDRYGSPERRAA